MDLKSKVQNLQAKTTASRTYIPTQAFPPGETIRELIEEKGISQRELAIRISRPLKTVNEIIQGKTRITPESALQLETALGVPAELLNQLEASYRDLVLRQAMEQELVKEIPEAKKYPYNELSKWKWVPETKDPLARARNLTLYFGVTSLKNVVETPVKTGAFRFSTNTKISIPAMTCWLRKGIIDSAKIQTKDFDRDRLVASLDRVKALSLLSEPAKFLPELRNVLADCGVAFVITPELPGAPVCGTSRWITPAKVLIQLSLRYKYADIFWFNLFHEIGHVLTDLKTESSIDFRSGYGEKNEHERKVDRFAAQALLSDGSYTELLSRLYSVDYTKAYAVYDVVGVFSKKVQIHPGIIMGRLQHEGIIPKNFNGLRDLFHWST